MAKELSAFEQAIKNHLDNMAANDVEFAKSYANPDKTIEKCCKYICNEVAKKRKKSENCVAMTDEEVFGMAVHYYDDVDENVKSTLSNDVVKVDVAPESEVKPEPEKKVRKSRKKKEPIDSEIPEPLIIPVF